MSLPVDLLGEDKIFFFFVAVVLVANPLLITKVKLNTNKNKERKGNEN